MTVLWYPGDLSLFLAPVGDEDGSPQTVYIVIGTQPHTDSTTDRSTASCQGLFSRLFLWDVANACVLWSRLGCESGNWILSTFMPTWQAMKSWLDKFRDPSSVTSQVYLVPVQQQSQQSFYFHDSTDTCVLSHKYWLQGRPGVCARHKKKISLVCIWQGDWESVSNWNSSFCFMKSHDSHVNILFWCFSFIYVLWEYLIKSFCRICNDYCWPVRCQHM